MAMAYITMAFETKTAMNHVNKCKSTNWPNEPTVILLEELRGWAKPSNSTAILVLIAELSKV